MEDDVRAYLGEMKFKNLSKMAMDRKAGKRIVEQAKTHKELCQEKKIGLKMM